MKLRPGHNAAYKISGTYFDVGGLGTHPVCRMKVSVLFFFIMPTSCIFGFIIIIKNWDFKLVVNGKL